jgi:hypothetical protein
MPIRYTPDQLISFAQRLDPGLEHRDFAEAGQRLDHMPDTAFTSQFLLNDLRSPSW